MIQKTLYLLLVILLFGCKSTTPKQKNILKKEYAKIIEANISDKLIPITNGGKLKFGEPCAFVNKLGDTVIPFGRFSVFETDTIVTFTFVNDSKNGVVGINRKGEVLFEAFIYGDVQLDKYSDGLIRIIQNEKIGYSDKNGKIIIMPKYKCAFPFENGKAKVAFDCEKTKDDMENMKWKSESWFYIDESGKKINPL
jgi:hypothetical protein